MSQQTVERVLGRMVTDRNFRTEFFAEPARVSRENGFDLTSVELSALLRLDAQGIEILAVRLDPKIVRAVTSRVDGEVDSPTTRLPRARRSQRRIGGREVRRW